MEDLAQRIIFDNSRISQLDFVYLVACRTSVLIYRYGPHIIASLSSNPFFSTANISPAPSRVIDLKVFENGNLVDANIYWKECTHRHSNVALDIATTHM